MADNETYDINQRLALVCVDHPERQGLTLAALQDLGYRAQVAASALDTIERLRKSAYEVVIVDSEFKGATAHDNPVLKAIQAMPMSARRYIFVGLIGTTFNTFDNMSAFGESVNLVVHVKDVGQLKAILQRAIEDNDLFYRVFRQVLQEAGRR